MEKRQAGFRKGAAVQTPEGRTAIDKLKVGDLVLSKPESGEGPIEPKRVVNTLKFERKHIWTLDYVEIPVNQDLGKLTMLKIKQLSIKGKLLGSFATPNQPFYVKGKSWVALDQLKYGDLIPTSDPRVQVMILQVTPVLLTTSSRKIAAANSVVNILEANKRGETIDDVDLFNFYECSGDGRTEIIDGADYPEGFEYREEKLELTDTVYYDTVYSIEVEDHHTHFVWGNEKNAFLWAHNTTCSIDH